MESPLRAHVSVERGIVEFIATGGNTPQLQQRKFKLNKSYDFQKVILFLRKQLSQSDQFDRSSNVVRVCLLPSLECG